MLVISDAAGGKLSGDAAAAIRQLYVRHVPALRRYAERFCPDRACAVVVETFYHGHTPATVACQLGVPGRTARSRLHYALQALRRQMEDREAIEPR